MPVGRQKKQKKQSVKYCLLDSHLTKSCSQWEQTVEYMSEILNVTKKIRATSQKETLTH